MIISIDKMIDYIAGLDKKPTRKYGVDYVNIPMSFDIETTSFFIDNGQAISIKEYAERCKKIKNYSLPKGACMYVWQFACNEYVCIGRTWKEWKAFYHRLCNALLVGSKRRAVIYIHNLSYEFQFMRKWHDWADIFADSERKPIYARTKENIEFRCSYRLSGYSLATVAKNLHKHKIRKLTGDLDYLLLRHYKTDLTEQELAYCENDVLIITAYISERIEEYGSIDNIPLTQTGVVRRYVRKNCFASKEYKYLMTQLTITEQEYYLLVRAFAGGFTHAGALYSTQLCEDVTSYDFTSSYPTVLCSEKFPMSRGHQVDVSTLTRENFETLLNENCCLFDARFDNIKSRFLFENIISQSKCFECEKPIVNNGRLVEAKHIGITITETDFRCIQQFYTWYNMTISNLYVYEKAYLPKEIVKSVLDLYRDKTTLKGVQGKEAEYLHAKEMLNSIYGMCVTSIVRNETLYEKDEWTTAQCNVAKNIKEYNEDRNRFLYYHWGVWCTSYARRNLYTGIIEWKDDYIYSDTDSIKGFRAIKHKDYINNYNEMITRKLETVCRYYGLSYDLIRPCTIKGEPKPLGVWDYDGHYKKFKTLGAKRYLTENDNGKIALTVAGLSKVNALDYMTYKGDPFELFNDGLYIPSDNTGKNTHTYIDYEVRCNLIDYNGISAEVYEKSSVHLMGADYLLSFTDMYIDYLIGVQKLTK